MVTEFVLDRINVPVKHFGLGNVAKLQQNVEYALLAVITKGHVTIVFVNVTQAGEEFVAQPLKRAVEVL